VHSRIRSEVAQLVIKKLCILFSLKAITFLFFNRNSDPKLIYLDKSIKLIFLVFFYNFNVLISNL
jgi:hypothetical protein